MTTMWDAFKIQVERTKEYDAKNDKKYKKVRTSI